MDEISNADLLDAVGKIDALKARKKEMMDQIAALHQEVRSLDRLLDRATFVTDIIGGLCLNIMRDAKGQWISGRTSELGRYSRTVDLYERAGGDKCWHVRINEYDGMKNSWLGNERWYGGETLGMNRRYSYAEAQEIAEAWLAHGTIPDNPGIVANREAA